MSLSDGISSFSITSKKWRTLVSVILFILGVASLIWGTHNLLIQTQVPNCATVVDELMLATNPDVEDRQEDEQEQERIEEVNRGINSGLELGSIQVEISGAVENPGLYWISYSSRLGDLIKLSGGFTKDADLKKINQQLNLAGKLKDEQQIKIPFKQEVEMEEWLTLYCQGINQSTNQTSSSKQSSLIAEEGASLEVENEGGSLIDTNLQDCISINYASSNQLQTLVGVGEKTAQLIIEGRPYFKVSELLEVKGIGDATLEKLEPHICL